MTQLPNQKVLLLDIETRPTTAYVWGAYDQNVSPDQVAEPGGVICVGAKWLGEKECKLFSNWEHGHAGMLSGIHEMMSYADAVVTYNGERFDLPILQGEFILNDFGPTPPCTSIDCLKAVKKFRFFMNKLAFVGPLLQLGGKVEHEGFKLWVKVMAGDEKAQKRMEKYCVQDVRLLEKLYLKIRPFIVNHPHLGKVGSNECGNCGSHEVQSRGSRRTRSFKIQRLHCQACGAWRDGTRKKV